ncbi:MAG: protein translocase subunit SecF [Saccharofermentanales bacterium]
MNYKFYKNRFLFYGISVAIIAIGVATSFIAGIKLDIQFQGGSIVRYTYVGTLDNAKVLAAAEKAIGADISSIQENENAVAKSISINVAGREALTVSQTSALRAVLTSDTFKDNKFTFSDATLVSPSIGAEYLQKGLYALLIASVLIILYIWYRFRTMSTGPSAGFTALLALFHDVIIVFVAFVIFRIPLNESLIAVALTIIGYSTNDTIVIYDRIRENIRLENGKMALSDLVDKSINQSMTRSINTSAMTFGAVTIAYIFANIFGINSIQSFALPMMVGILTGFYSTVFIASPLWVDWKTRGGRVGI